MKDLGQLFKDATTTQIDERNEDEKEHIRIKKRVDSRYDQFFVINQNGQEKLRTKVQKSART